MAPERQFSGQSGKTLMTPDNRIPTQLAQKRLLAEGFGLMITISLKYSPVYEI
jgi:hypothetical protein